MKKPSQPWRPGESCNQPDGVEHVLVTSGVGVPTGAVIFGQA